MSGYCAVHAPSIGKEAPVILRAVSLHRNKINSPISYLFSTTWSCKFIR